MQSMIPVLVVTLLTSCSSSYVYGAGNASVQFSPTYGLPATLIELCLLGEHSIRHSPAQGCLMISARVGERDPIAAAAMLIEFCRSNLPDETVCGSVVPMLRVIDQAGRLGEVRDLDLLRAAELCERLEVSIVCSDLAAWSRSIEGDYHSVPRLGLFGGKAEFVSLEERARLAGSNSSERASIAAEDRRRALAQIAERESRRRGRLATLSAVLTGVAAVAATVSAQATGEQQVPGAAMMPQMSPVSGDTGCACTECARTYDGDGQAGYYCAAVATAQCYLANGCYQERGCETATTESSLREIIRNNQRRAAELGSSCP